MLRPVRHADLLERSLRPRLPLGAYWLRKGRRQRRAR